jgi:hypothetical protein
MADTLQYASHVDSPISHSSNIAQLTLGIGAIVVATIVVVYSGGTALLAFGPAVEAVATIGTAGSVGLTAGKIGDSVLPSSAECFIKTGIPTVMLGPKTKHAARADADDTKTRGWHEKKVAEGSKIVMLGPETRPMSRRGDRIEDGCGGTLLDGEHTILVGGEPSKKGTAISEADSGAVRAVTLFCDFLGATTTVLKGGTLNIIRGGAQYVAMGVGGDTGDVLKAAATGRPGGVLEGLDAATNIFKGSAGAANIGTAIVSPATPTP